MSGFCKKHNNSYAGGYCIICANEVTTEPAGSTADLERDAKRYRWLRERDLETIHNGGVFAGVTPANYVINGIDLDNAIDWAIANSD